MTIIYTDTLDCDSCHRTIGLDSGDGFVDMIDGSMITVTGWRLCPDCADICTVEGYRVGGTCHYSDL